MKNRIINQILSKGNKDPTVVKRPHVTEQDIVNTNDMGEWLKSNDRSRGKSRSSVILKCDGDKKLSLIHI